MKKVIVTRENYEEVMFDLLEDTYPKKVRENVLDQIHADTFLNFEWTQWSKATFSESTEVYKDTEAEFLESLVKEEENKKRGLLYYIIPMAAAASILLFTGIYFFYNKNNHSNPGIVHSPDKTQPAEIKKGNPENNVIEYEIISPENRIVIQPKKPQETKAPLPQDEIIPRPLIEEKKDSVLFVAEEKTEKKTEAPTFRDTIKAMIASAKKQPRYKVTITEGVAEAYTTTEVTTVEKRYSMADVLNHKDGISLSKFLQNPNSRIVTDMATNKVTIEYTAADHSVLVLTLSN